MATVAGLFERYEDADLTLKRLNEIGYDHQQISIVASQQAVVDKLSGKEGSKEGGAAAGAVVGGLAGLLLGVGVLVVPGIGPVLSAGALATLLGTTAAGAGVGAATGGLRGALAEMDVPDTEAKLYAEGVQKGGILVTVIAESENAVAQVEQVFKDNHAVNLETRRSSFERGEGEEYFPPTDRQEEERRNREE